MTPAIMVGWPLQWTEPKNRLAISCIRTHEFTSILHHKFSPSPILSFYRSSALSFIQFVGALLLAMLLHQRRSRFCLAERGLLDSAFSYFTIYCFESVIVISFMFFFIYFFFWFVLHPVLSLVIHKLTKSWYYNVSQLSNLWNFRCLHV